MLPMRAPIYGIQLVELYTCRRSHTVYCYKSYICVYLMQVVLYSSLFPGCMGGQFSMTKDDMLGNIKVGLKKMTEFK